MAKAPASSTAITPSAPSHLLWGRTTAVCLLVSLVLCALAVPPLKTLISQIQSMTPGSGSGDEQKRRAAIVSAALYAQRRGLLVHQAIDAVYQQADIPQIAEHYERMDPDNGLYRHLELLQSLRRLSVGAARPEMRQALSELIARTGTGPPARLYHRAMYQEVQAAMLRAGMNPREAAVESLRVFSSLREQHRPVVRELAGRLHDLASAFRTAGEHEASLRAELLSASFMLQLVEDSPTFDVGLLAAERLPAALRAAAEDARRLGFESPDDAATAADAAAQLPAAWHNAATHEVNIIPFSGNVPADMAAPAQRELLRRFSVAAAATAAHVFVWILFLVLCAADLVTRGARRVVLRPRWPGGDWLGGLIVLAPLFILIALTARRESFTWLYTSKSGAALIWFTPLWLVTLAIAGRVMIESADPVEAQRLPLWSPAVLAGGVVILVFIGLMAMPVVSGAGRPPSGVQLMRKWLALSGAASAAGVLVWFMAGQTRRVLKGGWMGVAARTQLVVLARALPVAAAIMLTTLWENGRQDRVHQQIYAAAAVDPVADKLGADWPAHYFKPAQEVIERFRAKAAEQPAPAARSAPAGSGE